MIKSIPGPEEKNNAGHIWHDAFFGSSELEGFTETKSAHQQDYQQGKHAIIIGYRQKISESIYPWDVSIVKWIDIDQIKSNVDTYQ